MTDTTTDRPDPRTTTPDYESAFRAIASPHMVLDRELTFVDVNDAYCAAVERKREELVGRKLFDVFPNSGPSGVRLSESLLSVFETGERDVLPLIAYPITLPRSAGGRMEMRYWSAVHTPLLDCDGRVAFVMQNTVDVTELQRLKEIAYGPGGTDPAPGEQALFARAREVEEVNRALLQETQGLRDLFMQAPGFMAVLSGPKLTFALVNSAYQQLIGHRQIIGKPLIEALPEVREQGFVDLLETVMRERRPFIGEAVSVLLQRAPEGPLEERFLDFIYQPILRPSGEAWGVFVQGADVTDRIHAQRQQKLLLDELNHRVKNTLATVQAIAGQTLRSASDPASFRTAFEARLSALSGTHDLLTATSWRPAQLRDVASVEFRPYGPERYRLDGPDVALSPREALALGLIFHELATNAAKYGALSKAEGQVSLGWTVEEGRLSLLWREQGGPAVASPTRRGFGSRLIERSVQHDLLGEASLDYAAGGLVCRIAFPLAEAA